VQSSSDATLSVHRTLAAPPNSNRISVERTKSAHDINLIKKSDVSVIIWIGSPENGKDWLARNQDSVKRHVYPRTAISAS
jgi:hypothetical protein